MEPHLHYIPSWRADGQLYIFIIVLTLTFVKKYVLHARWALLGKPLAMVPESPNTSRTSTEERLIFILYNALRFRKKCGRSLRLTTFPQKLWPQSSGLRRQNRIRTLRLHRYCGCDIIGSIPYMAEFPLRHWQTEKVIIKKRASNDVWQPASSILSQLKPINIVNATNNLCQRTVNWKTPWDF